MSSDGQVVRSSDLPLDFCLITPIKEGGYGICEYVMKKYPMVSNETEFEAIIDESGRVFFPTYEEAVIHAGLRFDKVFVITGKSDRFLSDDDFPPHLYDFPILLFACKNIDDGDIIIREAR